MDQAIVNIAFPGHDGPEANKHAQSLLDELLQDAELRPYLDLGRTKVARADREAMDFGVTLIAVLGTPAIIVLANAVKSWAERKGVTVIGANGVRIENVRSQDVAAIARALQGAPGPAPAKGGDAKVAGGSGDLARRK